jgi:hypothetical protein
MELKRMFDVLLYFFNEHTKRLEHMPITREKDETAHSTGEKKILPVYKREFFVVTLWTFDFRLCDFVYIA